MAEEDKTLTENCSVTFSTAGDERVDFFFHITEDAEKAKTTKLLRKSWNKDRLDTLKLVAFLRDCRNGKGIKRQYQICLLWLFKKHFNTLVNNLATLVSFGYWKDVLHLLLILLFDGYIPEYMATDDGIKTPVNKKIKKKSRKHRSVRSLPRYDVFVLKADTAERRRRQLDNDKEKTADKSDETPSEMTSPDVLQTVATLDETLRQCRTKYFTKRYNSDEKYRKLYDKVVQLFAEQLKTDFDIMTENNPSISLAAKWAPTNGHHFDKYLDISGAIAKRLCELMAKTDLANDTRLAKNFYQTRVCAPLRTYLKVPEVYMSANRWSLLDYNRVASKCMQKNRQLFIKHDSKRFEEFLASKKTISGAVLKPVELVDRGDKLLFPGVENVEIERQVLEKQWLSLVEDIKGKGGGLLSNAIAVCDVSGSMSGTPMSAARALTFLIMSISSEPWNSLCITFSESPEFHSVDPNSTFIEKLESVNERNMKWGGNTNIDKVFDVILTKAVEQRLTAEQMPKLVFIFTDMEFDSASPNTSLTNYESAKQKFANHNYKLPPIVFWNLRGNTSKSSTPVQIDECGTALMSGYSGQQLSLIMRADGFDKLNPYLLMRSAIDAKRYENLAIYD